MTGPSILIAGGGSGGHVTPGIAVAEALHQIDASIDVTLAVSDRSIDATMLTDTPWPTLRTPARPLRRSPMGLLRFLMGFHATRAQLKSYLQRSHTRAVLLLGGFVAGGVQAGARLAGVPTLMLNLDAVPGVANRWITRRATVRATAVQTVPPTLDQVFPGVPVRRAARPPADAASCRERLGLDPNRRTLLVTGASQGARSINALMRHLAGTCPQWLEGWQVIHLTGGTDEARCADAWHAADVPALVQAFRHDMGLLWGAADVCVARAGASTVAEARFAGVPAVYLPYPWHKDRHQWHNAEPSVQAGVAVVVDDAIEPDTTWPAFGAALEPLLQGDALARMQRAAASTVGQDGAHAAAEALLKLATGAS